jgi:molybdenum cofactor cytidylyltransferase
MAKIGAVLLAAGSSIRFGASNKLLVDIGGQPLVRSVAEATLRGGAISEMLVVTGCDQSLVEHALNGLPLRFVNNENWCEGIGSSIAIGVSALASEVEGGFIVPGDMPLLTSTLLECLIAEFVQCQGASIIFPATSSVAQRI